MSPAIYTAIAISLLRHLLTVIGAKAYADDHSSQLESVAGFLIFIGSVTWGAWNARDKKVKIEELKEQVKDAEQK